MFIPTPFYLSKQQMLLIAFAFFTILSLSVCSDGDSEVSDDEVISEVTADTSQPEADPFAYALLERNIATKLDELMADWI